METVVLDKCKTCEGHCCTVFAMPITKEKAMKIAQDKAASLIRRKDALKFINWAEELPVSPRIIHLQSDGAGDVFYKCKMFINGKCSVYEARPTYCKLFTCHGNNDRMFANIALPPILKESVHG